MQNVKVVTAFVPLIVKHMSAEKYHELGQQMLDATGGRYRFFDDFDLHKCWLYSYGVAHLPPATETPSDRYTSPAAHVWSHIVQHSRTQWALMALEEDPTIDTIVWLDLGILKQGAWNGYPVMPEDVTWLLDVIESQPPLGHIPFPGISQPGPVLPHGNNWRFCGSTHIWPTKFLKQIDRSYRHNLLSFIHTHQCVPLDLTIWPMVEHNSGLPFKWYKAEYDASQLRAYPCAH